MPAYPFVQMPTLGEFVRRARDGHGCRYEHGAVTILGPDGESRLSVLSRGENGEARAVVLPHLADDERLAPHVLRNLCDRLGIPRDDFGFDLSEEGIVPMK